MSGGDQNHAPHKKDCLTTPQFDNKNLCLLLVFFFLLGERQHYTNKTNTAFIPLSYIYIVLYCNICALRVERPTQIIIINSVDSRIRLYLCCNVWFCCVGSMVWISITQQSRHIGAYEPARNELGKQISLYPFLISSSSFFMGWEQYVFRIIRFLDDERFAINNMNISQWLSAVWMADFRRNHGAQPLGLRLKWYNWTHNNMIISTTQFSRKYFEWLHIDDWVGKCMSWTKLGFIEPSDMIDTIFAHVDNRTNLLGLVLSTGELICVTNSYNSQQCHVVVFNRAIFICVDIYY